MVVAGPNPTGVLSGQRLPCHSPFRHPALTIQPSSFHHSGLVLNVYIVTYYLSLLYVNVVIFALASIECIEERSAMGTEARRKVQVFSSEVVEEARMLLTQKTTEPVPQPGSFMIGAVIRTLLPLLVELRRKGYSLTMLTHLLEEKGIRISPTALSGYMAKLSGPVEEPPARARRERPQTSTSASQTRGTFVMKPDVTL
jgi:hypothetical protein